MNKVLVFFNKITGLMVFLIFVIVLITHLQHAHHHGHWGRWDRHGMKYFRDSNKSPMKSDTAVSK